MPQLTIDLSDEAFSRLQERAQEGDEGLESQVTRVLERSLLLSPQDSLWVSKHFQTTLTSIKGFASTLLMDEDGTMFEHSDRMEFYTIIEKECDALRACLQPVPEIIRFHAQQMQLREVLDSVKIKALASPRYQHSHKLLFEFGDGTPTTFLTDSRALSEILWTFIDEALAYTPHGGEIRLQICREENDGLSFSISHQGLGLTQQFIRRFTKHLNSPTPPERVLGGRSFYEEWLFIQWHGGELNVSSEGVEKGKGYTIFFTLPAL